MIPNSCPQCGEKKGPVQTSKYCGNCGTNMLDEAIPLVSCRLCHGAPRFYTRDPWMGSTAIIEHILGCCGIEIPYDIDDFMGPIHMDVIAEKWNKVMGDKDEESI